MSNYALHFTPGPADDAEHEMYVWFQTDGIHSGVDIHVSGLDGG